MALRSSGISRETTSRTPASFEVFVVCVITILKKLLPPTGRFSKDENDCTANVHQKERQQQSGARLDMVKQIERPHYNPARSQGGSHHFCTRQRFNRELTARSCPKKYYCPAPRARPEGVESKPEETRTRRRKRRLDRHRNTSLRGP